MSKSRLVAAGSILFVVACQAKVDTAKAGAELMALDQAWAAAAGGGASADSIVSFWSDDARVLMPNEEVYSGKDAIKAMVARSLAVPGFHITWTTERAVVSASGDMGYTTGTNRITVPDSTGKTMTIDGRFITVWRKGADGKWRCVEDIFNSGPMPAAAPAPKP